MLLLYIFNLLLCISFALNSKERCDNLRNLQSFEKKVFSQNGEDGVLLEILNSIGSKSNFFVEFGVQNGEECNTRILRETLGYTGVMLDGGFDNQKIGLHKEFVSVENIVDLFIKYKVPEKFDVLSVDTDMFDWWLLERILNAGKYRPRVIIVEVNPTLGLAIGGTHIEEYAYLNSEPLVVMHPSMMEQKYWDLTRYFGANPMAFQQLGKIYGYEMVYCERLSVNCFMVLASEISEDCGPTHFPLPLISYVAFGVPGLDYAGHAVDSAHRKLLRLDDEILTKITSGNYTNSDLLLNAMSPIPNPQSEFFERLCSPPSTHFNNIPIYFPLDNNFNKTDHLSLSKKNQLQVSDYYTTAAMKLLQFAANISLPLKYFEAAALINPKNLFAKRSVAFLTGIINLSNPISLFSTAQIKGELSKSGTLVNRTLGVNFCREFSLSICEDYFVGANNCATLYSEIDRILQNDIMLKSDDIKMFLASRSVPPVEKAYTERSYKQFAILDTSVCPGIKSLNNAMDLLNKSCLKSAIQQNVLIFGPQGPGLDYIESITRMLVGNAASKDSTERSQSINQEVLCLINPVTLENTEPSCQHERSGFPMISSELQKKAVKTVYAYRHSLPDDPFVFADHSLIETLSAWRSALDESQTSYILFVPHPVLSALYICRQNSTISVPEAIMRWTSQVNLALKFVDMYRYDVILVHFTGKRLSSSFIDNMRGELLTRLKHNDAFNANLVNLHEFYHNLSMLCVEKFDTVGVCEDFEVILGSQEFKIALDSAPSSVINCFKSISEPSNSLESILSVCNITSFL